MARSNGHVAVAAVLGFLCRALWAEFAAFASPWASSRASGRQPRSRVSLAATQADLVAAKQEFELKQWAAEHLASESSATAAAAAARAQQAEATYLALKAQLDGQAPPAAAPAASTPAAAAPAVAAPAGAPAAATRRGDVTAAKKEAQLLVWAAKKLAREGSPQAAGMKAKAGRAIAAFEALVQAQAGGAATPALAAPAPAAPSAAGPSRGEVPAAKREAQLHEWVEKMLGSSALPPLTEEVSKAAATLDSEEDFQRVEKEMKLYEWAERMLASSESAPSVKAQAEQKRQAVQAMQSVLKAKKAMELHDWAARMLASSDSLEEVRALATEKRQTYEALKAKQEQQLTAR